MMEIASPNYFPELGMEDPTFFHQYPMDSFACPLDDFDLQCFNYESTPDFFPAESPVRPTKKLKITSYAPNPDLPSSRLISFEHFSAPSSISSQQFHNLDSNIKPKIENIEALISYEDKLFSNHDNRANHQQVAVTTTRNPIQAQEHVIAERKRREKLSQNFIALSAIVPGLKKMDKASVLGDAIKYVKQLKERVQTLEEQAAKKSAVLVKRSILFSDDDSDDSYGDQPLPEIEVRVSGKDVLIKIQCDKHSGRAATILAQLEKHHLTVQSSTFLPFGNNIIDVTIVAQMNKESCMTAKDLLQSLRQALRLFI